MPATRALLDIGIISLRSLTIIPERRGRRRRARDLGDGLDIDLRRGCDNNWWVGIWLPIVGAPVWPQGDDNTGPDEDMPVAMPAAPGVP